ncbi:MULTISPECIES: septal ring lytic transglycosylase RlpA family protein [Pseudomonas]|jgi:rare lipoprotein A|uniref:Endolytic peptidoglycan transglycosylase RlpA n=1 Tax=Pseudomonas proteolytica TaxID=219574 RepID=A0AAP7CTZ0_9PSED|nr:MULTISPECIES: septal ring lytic transglycosylase RlpA family protein [Pseudomonas]TDR47212.1 rare lipoprotein A [Pseudomonas brenneri]VVN90245.1 Endolytic peptidoglycan transglycosylase RlpA [Pseudomonas fluorescens]KAA8700992.1 septal ring lytic transglycosylase RlpA family protein [Pseudomonas proteolytica]MBC3334724.1 septal ring lytic transglycosylase RlpA family protein [Pseudomonas proteolytica]MCF5055577.1 septal ring lytic transglycosylase RlpA family protein [Pseudomonas proteolyti
MRVSPINKPLKLVALAALSLLVVSCSTSRAPVQKAGGPVVRAQPGLDINRAHKDGAPWWDVDVSRIPDATPTLHTGNYKANPYTVLGKTYFPLQESKNYVQSGTASWYGTKFHGQNTANGEVYDLYGMSAAHKTLPLPAYVRVTNLDNNRTVILRVNDRGPFYSDRIIDLSYAAAKKLGYAETGTARVKVEGIDPAQYWAQRGKPAPLMLNEPQSAQPQITASAGKVEQWTPPPQQHAAPVVAVPQAAPGSAAGGQYLQVGAFANPDAAELLRSKLSGMVSAPVFISSIVRNQQTLHRVRLGPIGSAGEIAQVQNSVRLANLGQPSVVSAE